MSEDWNSTIQGPCAEQDIPNVPSSPGPCEGLNIDALNVPIGGYDVNPGDGS